MFKPGYEWQKRSVLTVTIAVCFAVLWLVAPQVSAQGNSFDTGVQLYKAGKYGAAANKLLEAVKFPGKEGAAYYYLGCCYYKLNRPAEARAIYRQVVNNYPSVREAGLAAQMLQRLDPSYQPPPGIGGATGGAATSSASSVNSAISKAAGAAAGGGKGFPGEDFDSLPNEARVPFTIASNGHMQVTVYLDNRPITAWFDTGANAHFGKNHLEAAGIQVPRGEANTMTSGWAGNGVPAWRQQRKIRMGNLTRFAPVTVEEHMDLSPLVGQEFIQGYQCEVDNGSHYIILRKMGAYKASGQQVSDLYDVPCVRRHMRDYVPMTINGKKLEVLVDTGAAFSIFNEEDLKSIGIRVPEDAATGMASGVGGGFVVKYMNADVRLGPIWKNGYQITVGGSSGSAVGQDILNTQRFTIDREQNLMRFFH